MHRSLLLLTALFIDSLHEPVRPAPAMQHALYCLSCNIWSYSEESFFIDACERAVSLPSKFQTCSSFDKIVYQARFLHTHWKYITDSTAGDTECLKLWLYILYLLRYLWSSDWVGRRFCAAATTTCCSQESHQQEISQRWIWLAFYRCTHGTDIQ